MSPRVRIDAAPRIWFRRGDGLLRSWLPLRVVRGHPRLFIGVAAVSVAGSFCPAASACDPLSDRLECRRLALFHRYRRHHDRPRISADPSGGAQKSTDEGKFLILLLTSLAAIASIGAIVAQLAVAQNLTGAEKGFHVGLAAVTIVSAWLFIHLVFAFHYAHEYFDEFAAEPGKPAALRGGLVFPGTEEPDYYDFLYFSYVIGVACADRRCRHLLARRCGARRSFIAFLAFFFNSAVLALTINIAAGLM